MSAYVIARVMVTDHGMSAQYAAASGPTIAKHNGEIVASGHLQALVGTSDVEHATLIRFASRDAAIAWYQSEEHQAALALRDKGQSGTMEVVGR